MLMAHLDPDFPHSSSFLDYETLGRAAALRDARAHCRVSYLNRNRWIFPVCVFGSACTNITERGYLYGAIVALTWFCSRSRVASSGAMSSAKTT